MNPTAEDVQFQSKHKVTERIFAKLIGLHPRRSAMGLNEILRHSTLTLGRISTKTLRDGEIVVGKSYGEGDKRNGSWRK
jgi:hypothetical protein